MATATYLDQRRPEVDRVEVDRGEELEAPVGQNEVAAATGRDHNFLSQALTAGTEVTATGYSRKTLAGIAVTEDDANDRVDVAYIGDPTALPFTTNGSTVTSTTPTIRLTSTAT